MGSRWWQHDDRTGGEAPRAAYNSGHSAAYGRQQDAAQQQYSAAQQQQQQAALRADAEPFKPQGPAPGFNRAAQTASKAAALPKVWEYEDPLKDVHGPFDAAQIINWFAQVGWAFAGKLAGVLQGIFEAILLDSSRNSLAQKMSRRVGRAACRTACRTECRAACRSLGARHACLRVQCQPHGRRNCSTCCLCQRQQGG